MKNIGIITMHRVVNHGSFLQAYGLKKIIESNIPDAVCEFIDLPVTCEVPNGPIYRKTRFRVMKNYLHRIAGYKQSYYEILAGWHYQTYWEIYQTVLREYLNVTAEKNNRTNYDTVVIGSDEVFNCTQEDTPWGSSMLLFGANVESANLISYAASFGYTTENRLKQFGIYELVARNLQNFQAISVRDDNSAQLVQKMTGKTPCKHLDPVLIYEYDKEVPNISRKKYIVVYQYPNRIDDQLAIKEIRNFAKKNRLKIISVFGYCDWADENFAVAPFTAMGYIKNADYVVTDTFHGCVMSIKYHKKFAAFVRKSNYNKLYDLLKTFQLEQRIVQKAEDISNIMEENTAWKAVDQTISEQKRLAVEYLKANV